MTKPSARNNRGAHSRGQKEIEGLPSKQVSASSSVTGTQVTCCTDLSRSRTPSPQQQQIRGMDPGGLIVIPRRQPTTINKKSAKSADVVAAASDKEVKWSELPKTQQQKEEETAIVVASAVVTPPSTLTIDKASSSGKDKKNDAPQVKETGSKSGKTNSKSAASAAVGNERVTEATMSAGRQYRAHLWSSSGETKQPSSKSRTITSRGGNGVDDSNRDRSNQDGNKVRKNIKSKLSRESNDAREDKQNKKSGETKEKPTEAKQQEKSKKKSSKQLRSISGSRDAIRSFSRKRGQKSWKDDGDVGKKKSWKDSIGSSPEKKSFMKRLGSKLSGKSTTVADTADESGGEKSSEISLFTIAPDTPTAKSQISSQGKARGRRQLQQRGASKRPPSPQATRCRPSLSPDRSESSQNSSDRERSYSRSGSPSPSRRRNRRSLSPHSSRASSYSGSRSPSRRRRRSYSPHSCSSYSRSRSPSPRRRRSLSQSSHASVSISFYSRSRSPSPRRRYSRSVSPPSPRYSSRKGGGFHYRSRTPSPQRRRKFGGARRRRRSSSPGVNQNRRDSFCSFSPPRGRRSNDHVPMKKQSSFNAVPRRSSFSSRSRSPQPRGGRRQMSGNQHRNSGYPGSNRPISSRRGIPFGQHGRGSNSPSLNLTFSHHARDTRSDFDPARKVKPADITRLRSVYQRHGSESRITRTQSPPRMPPPSRQRQISDGYKRPVCRSFAPNAAVESQALVVRDLSPSTEQMPITSTPALVPRVQSQSLSNRQAPVRRSSSSESTGVWIDCPKQTDPCDEDLTFSECPGSRDDDSDATYDATNGFTSPGTPSVTHSFATYAMSDGPPAASGRQVEKLTKPGQKGSNQIRSKAADLSRMTEIAENPIKSSEGSWRSKYTTEPTEEREDASMRRNIARNLSSGSLPSLKMQCLPFVPGPPPRKPPPNMSLSSGPEQSRPKPSEFVRNNVSNSRTSIESNGPATQQQAQDDPPSSKSPPPPPFLPRPKDSPTEVNQPETSHTSFHDLPEGPSGNACQQYLPKGSRNSSVSNSLESGGSTTIRRSSSASHSLERETNRGRRASSTERNSFRGRSLSAGRTHDRQVIIDDSLDLTEVESGLRRLSSGTFSLPNSSVEAVNTGMVRPPPPSHKSNGMFEGPSSDKDWQQYLTKGNRNTSRGRRSRRSNSPERDTSRESSKRRSLSAGRRLFGRAPEKLDCDDRKVNNVVKDMPFTDRFGDSGIYTGQVNENGRPDGKGSMKYNNGIFYEGTWTDGSQDEKAATQYDRIRGGFTSWGGKGKVAVKSGQTLPWNAHRKDKHDENEKLNVRGMEWVDLNGDEGRYTGEVNDDKVPHGQGIMKYDFGLIAEGEWVYGVLKERPHDRVLSAAELSARGQGADAMSVMSSSLRSLGRSSGSVGPMRMRSPMLGGGTSIGSGMRSGMSVGPGIPMGQGSMCGSMPQMMMPQPPMMMMQPQLPPPMMMMIPQPNNMLAQQNAALIAHQNAMMKTMMYGGGAPPMVQMPPPPPQQQQQNSMQDYPPISEIKFS
ncbi:hypothetical protein ACHAWT_003799 [Skeletonema menzelii]